MGLTLYTMSGSPYGWRVALALEHKGLAYELKMLSYDAGDLRRPDFVALNPNSKIPAIVDEKGPGGPIALFESGAILIYLAEKTGQLLPRDARRRAETLVWLMFQMGGVGPMFGQAHHFLRAAPEPVPYGIERYTKETRRLYGVMDKRLAEAAYLAGEYSIADVATYPWVARHEWHKVALADFPNVARWYDAISARPAVARGMRVPG